MSRRLTHEEIWRRYDAVEARVTAPVSERMIELACLEAGMHVLDLATGRGEPALRAAQRVGPLGRVVGVDPSAGLLEMAREAADRLGVSNLDLRTADAETLDDVRGGEFGAATCRWGLMYMRSPVDALTNARAALSPEGVLVAALWAEPERVPYSTMPRRLLERYRDVPAIDPEAPGTFRYADLDRIVRDFGLAGLEIDHVEEIETPVFEADVVEEMLEWVRALGMNALLENLSEADERAWEDDLRRELESSRSDGVLRLGGVTRLVRAYPE